jgi:hypothetical protein
MAGAWLPELLNFIIIVGPSFTQKNVYQFTCAEQEVPENCKVQRSSLNCGSLAWNVFHITFAPRILKCLPDFRKNLRTLGTE